MLFVFSVQFPKQDLLERIELVLKFSFKLPFFLEPSSYLSFHSLHLILYSFFLILLERKFRNIIREDICNPLLSDKIGNALSSMTMIRKLRIMLLIIIMAAAMFAATQQIKNPTQISTTPKV